MGEEVLSPAERSEVSRIVGAPIVNEAIVWDRPQVVRVETATDRFIAKRPWREGTADPPAESRVVHRAERAALELLSSMPDSPAPALIGASDEIDVLVMEHLPPAPSVADALLGDDGEAAGAAVVGLAETLARVHAWTADREPEYQTIRRRLDLSPESQRWTDVTDVGIEQFRQTAAALGVDTTPAFEAEARQVVQQLRAPGWWRGLVHGDPCPDNTSVVDGQVRLFDFEHTNFGSVLLDASYVVAPFPTCWCFARIPAKLGARALAEYRRGLATVHPEAADDETWRDALTVALSSWSSPEARSSSGRWQKTASGGPRRCGPACCSGWTRSYPSSRRNCRRSRRPSAVCGTSSGRVGATRRCRTTRRCPRPATTPRWSRRRGSRAGRPDTLVPVRRALDRTQERGPRRRETHMYGRLVDRRRERDKRAAMSRFPLPAEITDYVFGRAHGRIQNNTKLILGGLAVIALLAMAAGYTFLPGGLALAYAVQSIRPIRGVATSADGIRLISSKYSNGTPDAVLAFVPWSELPRSEGSTLPIGPDRISFSRAERARLEARRPAHEAPARPRIRWSDGGA